MKSTFVFIIALICCQGTFGVQVETVTEVKPSPEQVLLQLKDTKWGSLALNMLQMQLRTGGPLEELIVAFKNLYNNLAFKINSENEDYRVMREEHLLIKRETQKRVTESAVRMGVSNNKLVNTLYPDQQTYQNMIVTEEDLISRTEDAIETSTREREASQAIYESNMLELDQGIDAIQECIALLQGLQQGVPNMAQVKSVKKSTKQLIKQIPNSKHNENLVLIKTLMKMAQDFADPQATKKIMDLFEDLLTNFLDEKENMTNVNNSEIVLYNNTLETNNNIITESKARKDKATIDLQRTEQAIGEEEGRLATATSDNEQATQDFNQEEARWTIEEQTHLELIAQLNDELDALNQIIDLFSSTDISGDMLGGLNQ